MQEEISFGTWLRKQRRALDLSRQAFADQVGCAEVTLRRIEGGTLRPSKELANILLEKFGIPETERSQWISFARGLSDFPAQSISAPYKPTTNLPAPLTTFIGREKEQADVMKLIAQHRLVTLTGSGGIGKSRLSMKVGEQIVGDYPSGVWLVELAPILDPSLVPHTTALTLGLREDPKRSVIDMLCDYLRKRRMLLLLDNCEHILDVCAQMIDEVLKTCPQLKILATSREPLNIMGEAIYRIPPLGVPNPEQILDTFRRHESIQLFEERAQLVQFDFSLTLENASSVAQICRRLDGIPLAIELAAAKVGIFSIQQIAKQLDESLSLLTGGSRTALPRQQTLRASMNWSWELLRESEQTLLRQVSVFAGGWTTESAQSICDGNVLELSSALVKKSLIMVNQKAESDTRYRLHELVRQYAYERLSEAVGIHLLRERHLYYFLKIAEETDLHLRGGEQVHWLNRLEVDKDNLRVALDWAHSNNAEAGLRLVGALWWFWRVRSYISEGCEWMSKMLALPNATTRTRLRAKVLHGLAFLESIRYDNAKAQSLYEESLSIYAELEDKSGAADALNGLGFIAERLCDWETSRGHFEAGLQMGYKIENKHAIAVSLEGLGIIAEQYRDWAKAQAFFEQFLSIERELGNTTQVAHGLRRLGGIAFSQGNISVARARYEESLSIFRELSFKQFIAIMLSNLAGLARYEGEYEQASALYRGSLDLLQEKDVGFEINHAMVLRGMGYVAYRQGQQARAWELFEGSLRLCRKLGEEEGSAFCLVGIAGILAAKGRLQKAVSLISAAKIVFDRMKTQLDPWYQAEYDSNLAIVRTQLDKASFEIAWAEGCSIRLEDAIDYALEDYSQGSLEST